MTNDVRSLIETIVTSIVDDTSALRITEDKTENGMFYEITVGKDDVAKLIGKGGRVATSLRTVARAAGAKLGHKVLLNVVNTPLD
jgi:predicted RNA-binding protein YlqC (UPF0109 family)